MASRTYSIQLVGSEACVVTIECHMSAGLPAVTVVGMTNKSVDESIERIRASFASSGLTFPKKRIIINLAPADIQKSGTSFDLAIAVSLLVGSRAINAQDHCAFFGELSLDGGIRPVRGLIGRLLQARTAGFTTVYVPVDNLEQALLVPQLQVVAVPTLKDLYNHLTNVIPLPVVCTKDGIYKLPDSASTTANDVADVIGQERAKRALLIAAAGGHNVLFSGPPGMGKSMLAKTLPSILPRLSHEEALQISHIHSLGNHSAHKPVYSRPFRSPHHSASNVSIVGGGQNPRPGEITMAHGGVLFLDELPEFSRSTIEALRQPLEDGVITVARAKETVEYPAQFMMVATRNPCPCGYFGSTHECICSAAQINLYNKKISGPIQDRIDIHVTVDSVEHKNLLSVSNKKTSNSLRTIVEQVRAVQATRYGRSDYTNANISTQIIKKIVTISANAHDLLNTAAQRLELSPRVYMKTIKIAQTIADLDGSKTIKSQHISEALQYRPISSTL